ncbi:MAG: hypothetical protein GYB49_15285 [Alphaproteobacteria bacterium]|nr:hypothetical protein [Alphaproteobacteria bacterium]|tara:strand:- start:11088 stop:11348 length:261 start_codon:yes stop_codon:yes gene_type:complete
MKPHFIVASLFSIGLITACNQAEEPADVEVTIEEPDTISENLDDAGQAIEESAEEASDEIEDAAEDASAAMNEAGESMTETTDTPN